MSAHIRVFSNPNLGLLVVAVRYEVMLRYGTVRYVTAYNTMMRYNIVCYGMVRYSAVWHGIVQNDIRG